MRRGFSFSKWIKGFARRRDGSVAVQVAVLVLPICILSFGLVDLNRQSVQKRQLQDALDAAALAAARSSAVTNEELTAAGRQALVADLSVIHDATLRSSSFVLNGPSVVATASMDVKPVIADLWTHDDMHVTASSEVIRTLNKLEVVLVLDNTGSMAYQLNSTQTKIAALRTAASNFVDTLATAAARSAEPNSVKIGLVPFSITVRLGSSDRGGSWIDRNGDAPVNSEIFNKADGSPLTSKVSRLNLFSAIGYSWSGCVESRQQPYDVQDTAASTATPATLITPFFAPDEPDTDDAYRNDYLKDGVNSDWRTRQGNISKYTSASKKSAAGYGPNLGCEMAPLMRMTTNWSALKTAINGMVADGNTNIPVGMMWGWHVLSPNAPFADGVSYEAARTGKPRTTKIAVLMSDGDNVFGGSEYDNKNFSAYEGYAYGWQDRLKIGANVIDADERAAAMDNRLKVLCANMKAENKVMIYTIGVGVSARARALLAACATSPDMYYDVTSAANLNAAFNAIAGSIDNLRISK